VHHIGAPVTIQPTTVIPQSIEAQHLATLHAASTGYQFQCRKLQHAAAQSCRAAQTNM
jgi:hypothetical protein